MGRKPRAVPLMWGLVLLFAFSAAQDPLRLGVMALLIARPRPIHNLLAFWLGLMATGFGTCLAALFLLRDLLLPVVRVVSAVGASPVVPPAQIVLGVLALSTALLLAVRSSVRHPLFVRIAGSPARDRAAAVAVASRPPGAFARLSSSCSGLLNGLLQRQSLGMAFVAGLCTSTQIIECGAAMMAILASGATARTQVGAALLFTLVTFVIVEVPLVSCLVSPTKTHRVVMRLHDWLHAHRRLVFFFVLGMVGIFMVVTGAGRI